jgi:hypothetical protein
MGKWRHSGFNVHCGPHILPRQADVMENLARHIIMKPAGLPGAVGIRRTQCCEPLPRVGTSHVTQVVSSERLLVPRDGRTEVLKHAVAARFDLTPRPLPDMSVGQLPRGRFGHGAFGDVPERLRARAGLEVT